MRSFEVLKSFLDCHLQIKEAKKVSDMEETHDFFYLISFSHISGAALFFVRIWFGKTARKKPEISFFKSFPFPVAFVHSKVNS